MTKWEIKQKNIKIVNLYMYPTLTDLKVAKDNNTVIIGNFNASISTMDKPF